LGRIVLRLPIAVGEENAKLVKGFAELMRDRHGARVYLFGSRARGTASGDSDYDLIAVADSFSNVSRFRRGLDRDRIWHEAGGYLKALDLHCYSPAEFRRELERVMNRELPLAETRHMRHSGA
jgi:predicted nucleotidyltransferase